MNFKSFETFVKEIVELGLSIPPATLVVAIPRSGLTPATILSQLWNVPLASFSGDEIIILNGGVRLKGKEVSYDNVYLVDDSFNSGRSMDHYKKLLPDSKTVAIYVREQGQVDYAHSIVDQPRFFQWNFNHHKNVCNYSAYDIDGVLCFPPTPEQNDDGEKYRNFILNAKPKHIPCFEINTIITSRLEKFRKETEQWLEKNKVKYKQLIMLNYPSGDFRRQLGHHGYHKGMMYKQNKDLLLFVEDEKWQAEQIVSYSGKPVLCVTNWRIYK